MIPSKYLKIHEDEYQWAVIKRYYSKKFVAAMRLLGCTVTNNEEITYNGHLVAYYSPAVTINERKSSNWVYMESSFKEVLSER